MERYPGSRESKEKNLDEVYLIDGSSYIHRAYHAIRNLSTSRGFPTNAIFGFCRMLLKLLEEKSPRYVAVVYDSKAPTFRHDLYKEYKATRPPMPEDLAVQLSYIEAIVDALEIKGIVKEGYEADDVMGTLARKCEQKGFRVVIVTGDKDMKQVITPRISLWDTMRDTVTDYASFMEKYGITPKQVVDVMGLAGDSSDNIPGVPGIGEKTALALIREYGTVENLYEHLDEIGRKRLRENLVKYKDRAILSKKLATIDQSVPIPEDVEDLKPGEPRGATLAKIFRELEFKGLWYRFAPLEEGGDKDYGLCLSEGELRVLKERIREAKVLSIDTVSTEHEPLRAALAGLSLCWQEGKACYVPLDHSRIGDPDHLKTGVALGILKDVLETPAVAKVGHDLKRHALLLRCRGIEMEGLHFDTMIGSYVINPGRGRHDLEDLAQQFLGQRMVGHAGGRGKKNLDPREAGVERAMEVSCQRATFSL
ncbi:MAG: hypothetical protein JRJ29_11045 [Deltaproteobacteria bacterium]|nr:hypothetical protein [Deltaproteobacteria bacterium]